MKKEYERNKLKQEEYVLICKSKEEYEEVKAYLNNKREYANNIQIPEEIITNYLLDISAPANLKGFKYIKEAISICIKETNNYLKINKGIYSHISKKYYTSNSAVESAMRRLINKTIENLPYERKQDVFKDTIYNKEEEKIPSNSLFIKIIAERINNKTKTNKGNTLYL